jgi:hypothetical protein
VRMVSRDGDIVAGFVWLGLVLLVGR